MSEAENNDRRKFLTNLVKWATAGAALLVIPAEVTAEEIKKAIQEDDLNMHGPIREAREILALPLSRSAADLFAPYDDGSPFLRRWAVGHVARGPLDQIIVVLVDLDTGGHAELHLYKNHISDNPVAMTTRHSIFLDNGALGNKETPFHLRNLSEAIADIVEKNEDRVRLDWDVPTYPDARRKMEKMLEKQGDAVGDPVGDSYGDPEGDPEGDPIGDPTGDPTGDPVGDPVGDPTGDPKGGTYH